MTPELITTEIENDIKELRKALDMRPTPGQWKIYASESHGTSVCGPIGVSVAWFGTNGTYGKDGSYGISAKEAKASAKWVVEASPERIKRLLDLIEGA